MLLLDVLHLGVEGVVGQGEGHGQQLEGLEEVGGEALAEQLVLLVTL